MTSAEQERARVVAWLDRWAEVASATAEHQDYNAGWRMCAYNAAREIERGDHVALALVSASGVPLTRRTRWTP